MNVWIRVEVNFSNDGHITRGVLQYQQFFSKAGGGYRVRRVHIPDASEGSSTRFIREVADSPVKRKLVNKLRNME